MFKNAHELDLYLIHELHEEIYSHMTLDPCSEGIDIKFDIKRNTETNMTPEGYNNTGHTHLSVFAELFSAHVLCNVDTDNFRCQIGVWDNKGHV